LAQQSVYTWTDEKGVVNFTNSAPPQGVNARASHSGSEFRPVPLEVTENRKLVRVEMQGTHETAELSMIVDTGAEKTMIDPALAHHIGVRWMRGQMLAGVTGVGMGSLVEVPKLRVGSAELRDVNVIVGPAAGLNLLGMDVLNALHLSVGQDSLFQGRN